VIELYILKLAFLNISRKRFMSYSVILLLFLGLLFPVLIVCYGQARFLNLWQNYKGDRYVEAYLSRLLTDDERLLFENTEGVLYMEADAFESVSCIIGGGYYDVYFNFTENTALKQLAGYSKKPKSFCLIGNGFAKKTPLKTKPGDFILINRKEIKITDTYESNSNDNYIYLSFDYLNSIDMDISPKYYIYAEENYDLKDISSRAAEYFGDILRRTDYSENQKELLYKSIAEKLSYLFAAATVVFLYSIMNLYNIILNKINEDKRFYGISHALGAVKYKSVLQNFLEILILSSIAVFGVIAILLFVKHILNSLMGYIFLNMDFLTLIIVFSLNLITAFLMSLLSLNKILKTNIIEIIKG
jgi:ABC-type antimicrobial peptide transport system permease subunit